MIHTPDTRSNTRCQLLLQRSSINFRTGLVVFIGSFWCVIAHPQIKASGPPSDQVSVRVLVRSVSENALVKNAYVALVPPYRAWSRPLRETITSEGTAIFHVPAGLYRVVGGASGKSVIINGPIQISAEQKNEIELHLLPLKNVSGTVRDNQGRPLSKVTIADVNALVEAPLGRLSELGQRQFGERWKTSSERDGTWSVSLPSDDRNPLVAEIPGYAVAWHSYKPGNSGPVDFVLQPGASLRVAVDRVDPNFVVTLVHRGSASSPPPSWQAQYWARRAVAPLLEWRSLPPGEYEVYAQQDDPRSFSKVVKLVSVALEAGAPREVRVQLSPSQSVPKALSMLFLERVARERLESLEAFGRDGSGRPKRIPHAIEEVTGGTVVYLNTTGVEPPFFATTTELFVSALADLDVSNLGGATPAPGATNPRGGASLHIRSGEKNLAIPSAGTARFHRCSEVSTITVPLEVRKDGAVSFPAPAGCAGFILEFDPFGPLLFSRPLPPAEEMGLGNFTLYPSGKAAIRVIGDDGSSVSDATVTIYAMGGQGSAAVVPIVTNTSQPDGWVNFERLPAGRELSVVARNPEGDRSVAERFRVEPRGRAIIDPLLIPRRATLIVKPTLDGAFVQAFPESRIELIVLDPDVAGSHDDQQRKELGGKESVEFERLRPGRWRITALIFTGAVMQPIQGDFVDLDPGVSKEISPEFKPLLFRGRVTERGKGVKGNIDIRGLRRSDVVPSVPLSGTGDFEAILPRPDTYQVDVRPRDPHRLVWIGEVAFVDPAQPIEIALPEGEIIATVHSDDRPLPNILVSAQTRREASPGMQTLNTLPAKTDAEGQARLEGILPGTWVVSARDEQGKQSAQKSINVTGKEPARVDFELQQSLALSGTVREAFGAPVPGARVACIVPGVDGFANLLAVSTSDDGTFTLEGTNSRSPVLCSVTSFSGAQGYRLIPGELTDLMLPASPAELRVLSLPPVNRLSTLWLVSRDGRVVDVSPYIRSTGEKEMLAVAALAPDHWKLVRISSVGDWIALTSGASSALRAITEVLLKPAERKTIDLNK